MEEIKSLFHGSDPRLRDLIEIGREFEGWTLLELDEPLDYYFHANGKFVLTGDAAHRCFPSRVKLSLHSLLANSVNFRGQGAAIGFGSASVLANLLSKAT